jgi:ribosome-binding factor A
MALVIARQQTFFRLLVTPFVLRNKWTRDCKKFIASLWLMAERINKVNSLLEHEISKIIFRDFAFSPEILVTVTRVEATANLIEAKVYISVFPEDKAKGIMNALVKSTFDIQFKINRILKMRPVPKIFFVQETEVGKAARVEELLAQAGELSKNFK